MSENRDQGLSPEELLKRANKSEDDLFEKALIVIEKHLQDWQPKQGGERTVKILFQGDDHKLLLDLGQIVRDRITQHYKSKGFPKIKWWMEKMSSDFSLPRCLEITISE